MLMVMVMMMTTTTIIIVQKKKDRRHCYNHGLTPLDLSGSVAQCDKKNFASIDEYQPLSITTTRNKQTKQKYKEWQLRL